MAQSKADIEKIDELNRQRKAARPAPGPSFQSGDLSDLVAASRRVLPSRSLVGPPMGMPAAIRRRLLEKFRQ